MWTVGWGGVFLGMKRFYLASFDTCQSMDGEGKVVPTCDTLVGEVVHPWRDTLLDDTYDSLSQVVSIGGGADLVENDAQGVFVAP